MRLWSLDLVRTFAFSIAIGLFLSFVGAFGSDQAPLGVRTVWFLAFSVFAGLASTVVVHGTERLPWAMARPWRRFLIVASAMTLVMGFAVWLGLGLALGGVRLEALPTSLFFSLVTSFAVTAIAFLIFRPPLETHAAPAGAPPPRFLERLPLSLKGGEVWAVEAEDHYLRVHTSRGSDLILMRLADAVAELEGIEGAQTHRSWWVARAAIAEARRGDGRARLILPSGVEAPVSRTYARALRAAGWF